MYGSSLIRQHLCSGASIITVGRHTSVQSALKSANKMRIAKYNSWIIGEQFIYYYVIKAETM